MKVYFVFNIKEEFYNLYHDNMKILFDVFKSIYNMTNYDIDYAYTLFNQLINRIDNDQINRDIFIKYHKYIPYSKRDNTHFINNLYKDEISRMTVKKSYIKIELDNTNTSWLDIIKNYSRHFFVCDFGNTNYFFLE